MFWFSSKDEKESAVSKPKKKKFPHKWDKWRRYSNSNTDYRRCLVCNVLQDEYHLRYPNRNSSNSVPKYCYEQDVVAYFSEEDCALMLKLLEDYAKEINEDNFTALLKARGAGFENCDVVSLIDKLERRTNY